MASGSTTRPGWPGSPGTARELWDSGTGSGSCWLRLDPIDDAHQLDLYHGYPYAYDTVDDVVDTYVDDGGHP